MSQFDSLFKADTKSKAVKKFAVTPESRTAKKKIDTSLSTAPNKISPPPAKAEKRAGGKSSNADYTQVLTYIKRGTHREVKKSLFDDPQNRDLSELVEELLTDWLKKNS